MLSDSAIILIEAWRNGSISTNEAAYLQNWPLPYASNILREFWFKGYLTRKKVTLPQGGIKFKYTITKKGSNIAEKLIEKYPEYLD